MVEYTLINEDLCTGCGLCAKVCGGYVISMDGKRPRLTRPEACWSCGHCAALCPTGAITANPAADNRRAFQVSPLAPNLPPVELLLRKKRSVREFTPLIPDRDTLVRLITYAEKAPSSSNLRRRRYVVVTDPLKLQQLEKGVVLAYRALLPILNPVALGALGLLDPQQAKALAGTADDIRHLQVAFKDGRNPIFRAAPCAIFIAAPKADVQGQDDCCIAQQYLMLYGETQGLGSCIIGYAQYVHAAVEKQLDLPKGYRVYTATLVGYPKYTYSKEILYTQAPEILWN